MNAVVITDKTLSVLASSPPADGISPKRAIRPGDALFEHVPALRTVLTPDILEHGCEHLVLNDRSVRILAAGDYLTFQFLPQDARLDELAALKHQNAFLEKVIEEAPIGIIFVDNEETVFGFNRQQEENSRVKREVVLGRKLSEIFGKTYQKNVVTKAHQALLRGDKKQVTIRLDHYLPQFYKKE